MVRCRLKDLLVYAEWETAELITFVEGLDGAAPGESDKVTRLELAALVVKVRPHGTPSGRAKCPIMWVLCAAPEQAGQDFRPERWAGGDCARGVRKGQVLQR